MRFTQADLDLANQHVSLGERHVLKQQWLIAKLRSLGESTDLAENLLDSFRSLLEFHRERRDYIAAKFDEGTQQSQGGLHEAVPDSQPKERPATPRQPEIDALCALLCTTCGPVQFEKSAGV